MVSLDSTPPTVELNITPGTTVAVGTQVTFLVFVSDDLAVSSLALTVGTTNVPLDGRGQAVMTMNTTGPFLVTATATDIANLTTSTSRSR